MTIDPEGIEDFDLQVDALTTTLSSAGSLVGLFDAELRKMQGSALRTGSSVGSLSSSISGNLRRAFDGLMFDGMKLSDAMKTVASSIIDASYSAAIKPVTSQFGSILSQGLAGIGAAAFRDGASFAQGRVMPFAKGGVVTAPTAFPMRGGTGLMGEAGPEAIMPLARGADGRLGVATEGTGTRPVQVVMNISTPDVSGFQRSQSQIAARVNRALTLGQRNR
ncbi:phage tail tape measure protein [Tropicimonas sp.]|uniref:phage tail tape measure protein n=1 Tax=Tropicimonas sp. TaxID=2067044 RepID=UPI003A836053